MFSIGKLLVLAILVVGVWYLFKAFSGAGAKKRMGQPDTGHRPVGMPPEPPRTANQPQGQTEDLVKCPVCSTYRPVDMRVSCGRDGCPAT